MQIFTPPPENMLSQLVRITSLGYPTIAPEAVKIKGNRQLVSVNKFLTHLHQKNMLVQQYNNNTSMQIYTYYHIYRSMFTYNICLFKLSIEINWIKHISVVLFLFGIQIIETSFAQILSNIQLWKYKWKNGQKHFLHNFYDLYVSTFLCVFVLCSDQEPMRVWTLRHLKMIFQNFFLSSRRYNFFLLWAD